MAFIFDATDRPEAAALAESAAAALVDDTSQARHQPLARTLARRGLEIAAEVTLGRVSASDVSRKPAPRARKTGPVVAGHTPDGATSA